MSSRIHRVLKHLCERSELSRGYWLDDQARQITSEPYILMGSMDQVRMWMDMGLGLACRRHFGRVSGVVDRSQTTDHRPSNRYRVIQYSLRKIGLSRVFLAAFPRIFLYGSRDSIQNV